jgi:Sulfatase
MIARLINRVAYAAIQSLCVMACLAAGIGFASPAAVQDAPKPNILVIWGDDIGWYNVSAYNLGVMGYQTPNIDRIAREGALFTDWYGQQSCTAGRAAFVTGQSPGGRRSSPASRRSALA